MSKRYKQGGEEGLRDLSGRPKRSPFKSPKKIEEKVMKMWKERGYGKRRIAYFLFLEEGIELSENTIRNILKRRRKGKERKMRKVFYPARWAYDEESL